MTIQHKRNRRRAGAALALLPLADLAAAAAGDSDRKSLETLIVTARKRNEVPSLLISPSNPRQTAIAIRGLGKNSANDGLETRVGVDVDGVKLSHPGQTAFDLADLDPVAVLRGPQGTLFGKNNTGGVLNMSTLKPSFKAASKGEFIVGSYGTAEFHGTTTNGTAHVGAVIAGAGIAIGIGIGIGARTALGALRPLREPVASCPGAAGQGAKCPDPSRN